MRLAADIAVVNVLIGITNKETLFVYESNYYSLLYILTGTVITVLNIVSRFTQCI